MQDPPSQLMRNLEIVRGHTNISITSQDPVDSEEKKIAKLVCLSCNYTHIGLEFSKRIVQTFISQFVLETFLYQITVHVIV